MKGTYLITTDSWFMAPDGLSYKAVYGEVEIVEENFLGIKTNARSSNWFAKVGSNERHVIIAGCQIHYAVKCDEKPNIGEVKDYTIESGEVKKYIKPSSIYDASK